MSIDPDDSVDGSYGNLNTGDTKATIFSTMLGAIITGTTLIVTSSQLVISRIATVAKRTLAVGPLILRGSQQ